ncbi:MAG TPA: hypothetical protein VG893_15205 [Terracidiphilus sp.]|nr:hypothetical protein [Terracidiphilus sp.]
MSSQYLETPYKNALAAAHEDLDEVCARIAELKARKEAIDKATAALKVLMGQMDAVAEAPRPFTATPRQVVEIPASNNRPARETGDPLQNSIRQALGIAATA